MMRTPLKNKKNVYVNKPFKSPFESPAQREESCKKAKQKCDPHTQSPLSTRNKEAKRILLLDDNEQEKKRRKLSENKDPELSETNEERLSKESKKVQDLTEHKESKKVQDLTEHEESKKGQDLTEHKESKSDKDIEKIVKEASKNDLQALKRKVFELRQELDCLKSKEMCTKKHNPDDLRISIKRWREACQNALEILCSELAERNGQSYKISDILKQLNIPETIVHYSEKDDSFI